MKTFKLLSDYSNATRVAAQKFGKNWLRGLTSVAKARLKHDIGPRYHSLYDLATVREELWCEYIDDIKLKRIMRKFNPASDRNVVNDKFAFLQHCNVHQLTTIPIPILIDRDDRDNPANGLELDSWKRILKGAPDDLFIKLIDGSWGIDAFTAHRIDKTRWQFCDQSGSSSQFHKFAMERLRHRRGWIMQPIVRNHHKLQEATASRSLSTIRMVTFLDGQQAQLLYAVLRIPTGDNSADNFSHGSSGNLVAPVDIETGITGTPRGSRSKLWPDIINVHTHPDSNMKIDRIKLPFWKEAVELAIRGQQTFRELRTLGWDIAITDDGPVIVEANATYDMDLIQVAYGRGLWKELVEGKLLTCEKT